AMLTSRGGGGSSRAARGPRTPATPSDANLFRDRLTELGACPLGDVHGELAGAATGDQEQEMVGLGEGATLLLLVLEGDLAQDEAGALEVGGGAPRVVEEAPADVGLTQAGALQVGLMLGADEHDPVAGRGALPAGDAAPDDGEDVFGDLVLPPGHLLGRHAGEDRDGAVLGREPLLDVEGQPGAKVRVLGHAVAVL